MKKKVLVLASTFPRWENDTNPPFVYELSKRLTNDFDITVLAPNYPDSKKYEEMDNMKVHRFRYFFKRFEKLAGAGGILPTLKKNKLYYLTVPFFFLGEYLAVRKLVKKEKFDVIHAHWIIPQGLVAYWINKKYNVDYVVTTHGGDIFGLQGKLLTKMKKNVLLNAKKITVVSSAIKKEILDKIDKDLQIEVIPMGVDSKLFNPNKKDLSLKKKYDITGPFLLFVGRLAEKKGVKYLIEAMPEVVEKFPKTKLMIIGTGTLEDELKDLTKKLNLEKNIIFLGAIQNKDLPKYYATADIFIAPSMITKEGDREGLPVTLMEAMASKCGIITTNLPGNRDIIKDSVDGFLVNQKDRISISKKIIRFIMDKKMSQKFKLNGVKNIQEKFDWEIIYNEYKEVIN